MATQFVKINGQWINPANVTRIKAVDASTTVIYFTGDAGSTHCVQLPIDEVMRLFAGLSGGPDTTYYGE